MKNARCRTVHGAVVSLQRGAHNIQMAGDRSIRVNAVPGISPNVSNPNALEWFNPAAFALQTTPYGTVGRDTVWGPGIRQWDLGFAKNFALSERRYFQFRGELFNAFNNVNYAPPISTDDSAGFGTITAARAGRNIQLGLKFYW